MLKSSDSRNSSKDSADGGKKVAKFQSKLDSSSSEDEDESDDGDESGEEEDGDWSSSEEEMDKQPSWIEDTNEIFDRLWGWKAEAENAKERSGLNRAKTLGMAGLKKSKTFGKLFGVEKTVSRAVSLPTKRPTNTNLGVDGKAESWANWRKKPFWTKKDQAGHLPINPDGTFRMVWNLGSVFMIIWTVIFAPIYLCIFDLTTTNKVLWGVEMVITGWFTLDIFVNFASAYWEDVSEGVSESKLQTSFKKIAKRYMRSWLFLDVIATFPFELITDNEKASVFGVLKVMRLLRLLRIAKLKAIVTRIFMAAAFDFRAKVAKELVNMAIIISVLAHWNSCAWAWQVNWDEIREYDPDRFDLTRYEDTPEQFAFQKWCLGMTWAIAVLTIGTTDPLPQKNSERTVLAVACLLNIVIVASIVGSLTRIVLSNSEQDGEVMTQLKTVGKAMKQADIPQHVVVKIRNFLGFQMGNESTHKCLSTLEEALPPNLFRELRYYLLGKKYLNAFAPLKTCGTYFVLTLMNAIEHHMCSPQDIIAQEGEEMLEMIFVLKGTLGSYSFAQAENPNSPILTDRLRVLPNRTAFCWFNELVLFQDANETSIHEETVTALSISELLVLSREEFESVVHKHTEWKERWEALSEQVNDPDADLARILGCSRCQSNKHYGDECPMIGGDGGPNRSSGRSHEKESKSANNVLQGGLEAGKSKIKGVASVCKDVLKSMHTTANAQSNVLRTSTRDNGGNRISSRMGNLGRSGTGYFNRPNRQSNRQSRPSGGFDSAINEGDEDQDQDDAGPKCSPSLTPMMRRGATQNLNTAVETLEELQKSGPQPPQRNSEHGAAARGFAAGMKRSATRDFGGGLGGGPAAMGAGLGSPMGGSGLKRSETGLGASGASPMGGSGLKRSETGLGASLGRSETKDFGPKTPGMPGQFQRRGERTGTLGLDQPRSMYGANFNQSLGSSFASAANVDSSSPKGGSKLERASLASLSEEDAPPKSSASMPKPVLKKSETASNFGNKADKVAFKAAAKWRSKVEKANSSDDSPQRPQSAGPSSANAPTSTSTLLAAPEVPERPASALGALTTIESFCQFSDEEEEKQGDKQRASLLSRDSGDEEDEDVEEREGGRVRIGKESYRMVDAKQAPRHSLYHGPEKKDSGRNLKKSMTQDLNQKKMLKKSTTTDFGQGVSGTASRNTRLNAGGARAARPFQNAGTAPSLGAKPAGDEPLMPGDCQDDAAIMKYVLGVVESLKTGALHRQSQIKQLNERLDRFKSTIAEVVAQGVS